jgi:hypothetical protein
MLQECYKVGQHSDEMLQDCERGFKHCHEMLQDCDRGLTNCDEMSQDCDRSLKNCGEMIQEIEQTFQDCFRKMDEMEEYSRLKKEEISRKRANGEARLQKMREDGKARLQKMREERRLKNSKNSVSTIVNNLPNNHQKTICDSLSLIFHTVINFTWLPANAKQACYRVILLTIHRCPTIATILHFNSGKGH